MYINTELHDRINEKLISELIMANNQGEAKEAMTVHTDKGDVNVWVYPIVDAAGNEHQERIRCMSAETTEEVTKKIEEEILQIIGIFA